jgi:SAM-dependent methyltransferase
VYSDAEAAALYDVLNPWHLSDEFYLPLIMAAPSALDIGCGTGTLLRAARASGHPGRLVGVDPDGAALGVARQRRDVEWLQTTAASMPFAAEFELATMTGHAFQCLVADEELQAHWPPSTAHCVSAVGSPSRPGTRPCAPGTSGQPHHHGRSSTPPDAHWWSATRCCRSTATS